MKITKISVKKHVKWVSWDSAVGKSNVKWRTMKYISLPDVLSLLVMIKNIKMN